MSKDWSEEADALVKQMRADGFSCGQIARELYERLRITKTRNAVIGRAIRQGYAVGEKHVPPPMPSRPKPLKQAAPRRRKPGRIGTFMASVSFAKHSPDLNVVDPEPLRCAEVIPLNLSLTDLNDCTCHWPVGGWPEATPITFCGHATYAGNSYCEGHYFLSLGNGRGSRGLSDRQRAYHLRRGIPAVSALTRDYQGEDPELGVS